MTKEFFSFTQCNLLVMHTLCCERQCMLGKTVLVLNLSFQLE